MEKHISEDKRHIEICYQIQEENDKKLDEMILNFIISKDRHYKFVCQFGIDSNNLRYIRISDISSKNILNIYEDLEKLFN